MNIVENGPAHLWPEGTYRCIKWCGRDPVDDEILYTILVIGGRAVWSDTTDLSMWMTEVNNLDGADEFELVSAL